MDEKARRTKTNKKKTNLKIKKNRDKATHPGVLILIDPRKWYDAWLVILISFAPGVLILTT
jgi:hypothetical protein